MSNDIVLEPEENIELNVIEPDEVIDLTLDETDEIAFDMDVVTVNTTYHNLLLNRDIDDQHPISAITGLEEALDGLEGDIGDLETELGTKQDTLISGVNIKTVDNQNILGAGNVATTPDWDDVQGRPSFATVATTGDYDDLSDKYYFAVNQSEGLVITKF